MVHRRDSRYNEIRSSLSGRWRNCFEEGEFDLCKDGGRDEVGRDWRGKVRWKEGKVGGGCSKARPGQTASCSALDSGGAGRQFRKA